MKLKVISKNVLNLEAAKKICASLLVLPLDDEACIVFGALSLRLRSEERRIGDFYEVIASIAPPSPATGKS